MHVSKKLKAAEEENSNHILYQLAWAISDGEHTQTNIKNVQAVMDVFRKLQKDRDEQRDGFQQLSVQYTRLVLKRNQLEKQFHDTIKSRGNIIQQRDENANDRDGYRFKMELLQKELDELKQYQCNIEELEASVCPEDSSFVEQIKKLTTALDEIVFAADEVLKCSLGKIPEERRELLMEKVRPYRKT